MEIVLKQILKSQDDWDSKSYGVIFVEKEEHIDPLFQLINEQDDYWERQSYKKLIRVLPQKEIKSIKDLDKYCSYVGKTDIYDVKKLKEKASEIGIDFFIYQNPVSYHWCNNFR